MSKKRFELKSFHFNDLNGVIHDNLEKEELHLSLYGIIELLNDVSQPEYDLLKLRDDICNKIDRVVGDG